MLTKAIPMSRRLFYLVWLYINEYKLIKWKHVLHKGDDRYIKLQPGIWLHPETNKLSESDLILSINDLNTIIIRFLHL